MSNNVARWVSLIVGILILICGIWLIFTPFEAYLMVAFFIPFAILFHGISNTIDYFGDKENRSVSGWMLADGIISIVIGSWLLFRPGAVAISLPYVFGFWVMFAGTLRIVGSFAIKGISKNWIWMLILGIIGIITGLILLYHPLISGIIVAYVVAWSFIFIGVQGIVSFFMLKEAIAKTA